MKTFTIRYQLKQTYEVDVQAIDRAHARAAVEFAPKQYAKAGKHRGTGCEILQVSEPAPESLYEAVRTGNIEAADDFERRALSGEQIRIM